VLSLENWEIIVLRVIFVKTFDRLSLGQFTLGLELSRLLFYIFVGHFYHAKQLPTLAVEAEKSFVPRQPTRRTVSIHRPVADQTSRTSKRKVAI
jgi:hypothetical protein